MRLTLREGVSRRLILAVLVLSVLMMALYAFGFHEFVALWHRKHPNGQTDSTNPLATYPAIASSLVLLGFYTINFLAGIMAIFAAVGSISGEVDNGVLHAIVPKPIRRWEIVVGKYLGYAVMLIAYIVLMVIGVTLTSRWIGHYQPLHVVHAALLMILVSLILLSLTMLGSTFFSTLANGVIVFMLYGIAVTGGLVEQFGTLLNYETLIHVGIATSLILPSDTVWRTASYVMQPPVAISFQGPNPFGTTVPASPLAIQYAVGYAIVLLLLAVVRFRYRDL